MRWDGIYDFDRGNERMCLLPMAARRALDTAGIHVSLAAWRGLSPEEQRRFAALGASHRVSRVRVAALVCRLGLAYRLQEPIPEPAENIPPEVLRALAPEWLISLADWRSLLPLDRYTLIKLAGRDRDEKARLAYREMCGRRSRAAVSDNRVHSLGFAERGGDV